MSISTAIHPPVRAVSPPHSSKQVSVPFPYFHPPPQIPRLTNPPLGRQAIFLRDRADTLRLRLQAIKSRPCASLKHKYSCPEIFLDVVADKLTSTAVLFLNVELLSEFYYNFPRELDARLGRHLSPDEVERFAREDPKVRRHLDVIRRKEMLERVLEKVEGLRGLEGMAAAGSGGGGGGKGVGGRDAMGTQRERKKWSLF